MYLVDVSNIFYFFLLGGGEGEYEAPGGGGGVRLFFENPRRGGLTGGWGPGGEGPGECLRGIGGGVLNFFFRGRNSHQVYLRSQHFDLKWS